MKTIGLCTLILSFLFFCTLSIFAEPVSHETARQVAKNIINERFDKNISDIKIIKTFTEKDNSINILAMV